MSERRERKAPSKKSSKDSAPAAKPKIHPRNKHKGRYDLPQLVKGTPELGAFVQPNKYGDESIDFANPAAVKTLNTALLKHHYKLEFWDIPEDYLCPPIPGRADYIHHMADVLCASNYGKIPTGEKVTCIDVGVGANCVYPIIGTQEYDWSFIGTDIDSVSIKSAQAIIDQNPNLVGKIELRRQPEPKDIFYGILRKEDRVDLTICNPPFHRSPDEAQESASRKVNNLAKKKVADPVLNFGGRSKELWCDGGERKFIQTMIRESKNFADSCFWFSSLVSKSSNLAVILESLEKAEAVEVKTIPMGQGNKSSRIVAWTFLNPAQQKEWKNTRWKEKEGSTKASE
ncbi:23S rRNA (adenine(1618)-N(6))-methyltransferase RlmF [Roseivirga echinicomitans]|uniref:Ribosomal RNA large subunit methyltransferase F n=1 Tax=Roseivirga echinicomitans TaxID=296218 RepID=A0A150XW82_9BACT|nr:23S rRNA (adenine(1618)-N(6))-methyltransferase RlmF [Roseivirga echinicomitans]KYG82885.1 23S rRNA methyltransferase [Roseivirga echinicomitans]